MTLERAIEILRNNKNAVENSFLYYLHECSKFNYSAYQEYYQCLITLGNRGFTELPQEVVNIIIHVHLFILGCFTYHFDDEDSYEMRFIPKNYSEYIEDINSVLQRIFNQKTSIHKDDTMGMR